MRKCINKYVHNMTEKVVQKILAISIIIALLSCFIASCAGANISTTELSAEKKISAGKTKRAKIKVCCCLLQFG